MRNFLVYFLLLLLVKNSNGQQNFWGSIKGPYYGSIECVTVNLEGHIFASVIGQGIYRSTDDGLNWTRIAMNLTSVKTIFIKNDNLIFAGSAGNGVYLSTDNGNSWIARNNGLADKYVLTIGKAQNGNIIAGTWSDIFISTDDGVSWNKSNSGDILISDIATSPLNGYIFATGSEFIVCSTDNGLTWNQTNFSQNPGDIKINSLGKIFVGTYQGVYVSIDNGSTWTQINSGLTDTTIVSLGIAPNGYLYAGTSFRGEGVFRSTNSGNTWSYFGLKNLEVISFAFNQNSIIASIGVGDAGLFRSSVEGNNWIQIGIEKTAGGIISAYANDIFMFIGDKLFKSSDYGNNWSYLSITDEYITSFFVASNNLFLAGNYFGELYKSTDQGLIWLNIPIASSSIQCLAKNINGVLLAGTEEDGIFISTDQGFIWKQSNAGLSNLNIRAIEVLNTGDIVIGTYGGGIFRSTDLGSNWITSNNGLDYLYVRSLASSTNNILYAGTGGQVFKSIDYGVNWFEPWSGNIYTDNMLSNKFGHTFAGGSGGGVYRTTDNGTIWHQLNSGLTGYFVSSFTIDSLGFIYVETDSGVFRSIETMTSIIKYSNPETVSFFLFQNYPNPFNPSTVINYQLPVSGQVTLKVYDVLGNEIATLVNEYREVGDYETEFNAEKLSSGVYYYQLRAGSFVETKKMVLLR